MWKSAATRTSVMFLKAVQGHGSRQRSATPFSRLSTAYHILGPKQQHDSWGNNSYGMVPRRMWRDGQESASLAREPRFIGMSTSVSGFLLLVDDRWWVFTLAGSDPHSGHQLDNGGQGFPRVMGSRFGVPAEIISDRGAQFISQLWSDIALLLGTSLHQTTAYHLQANGLVEWFHRQLKASLCARLSGHNWVHQLPWVMLGIRATHKNDMITFPAEMVYRTPLVLPGQFCSLAEAPPATEPFLHDLQRAMKNLQPVPTSAHCKAAAEHVPEVLQKCLMVWIRQDGYHQPLTPWYEGPFYALERHPKFFKIQLGEKQDNISIDRLKPATVPEGTEPVRPRKRGRPTKNPAAAASRLNQQSRSHLTNRQHHRGVLPAPVAVCASQSVRISTALGGGACSEPWSMVAIQFNAEGNVPLSFSRWNIFSW